MSAGAFVELMNRPAREGRIGQPLRDDDYVIFGNPAPITVTEKEFRVTIRDDGSSRFGSRVRDTLPALTPTCRACGTSIGTNNMWCEVCDPKQKVTSVKDLLRSIYSEPISDPLSEDYRTFAPQERSTPAPPPKRQTTLPVVTGKRRIVLVDDE